MANKDFYVKNGVVAASNNFTVNSTSFNFNNKFIANNTGIYIGTLATTLSSNTTFNSKVTLSGAVSDGSSVGTSGQVLSSTGTGVSWLSIATITANNTSATTHYLPMTTATSGIWSSQVISNNKMYFVPSTGTLSSTDFNALSDEKFKKDVKKVESPLEKLMEIEGVSFRWKDNNRPSYGVIAQQIESHLPELVSTNEEGNKTVNYDGFVAILIESIKVLEKRVKELESRL